jgi:hypothetical protein
MKFLGLNCKLICSDSYIFRVAFKPLNIHPKNAIILDLKEGRIKYAP